MNEDEKKKKNLAVCEYMVGCARARVCLCSSVCAQCNKHLTLTKKTNVCYSAWQLDVWDAGI